VHLQARDLKDIKRGNQVKSSKRQDLEETGFNEGTDENATGLGQVGHKRPRIDYSVFRTDVARLQQNLDDLETDLKQHSMQVRARPPKPLPFPRAPLRSQLFSETSCTERAHVWPNPAPNSAPCPGLAWPPPLARRRTATRSSLRCPCRQRVAGATEARAHPPRS
jgi:hypothetical protein